MTYVSSVEDPGYLQSPVTKVDEEGHSRDEATKPATKERTVTVQTASGQAARDTQTETLLSRTFS